MSATRIEFEVPGRPVPQGSARAFAGKGKAAGKAFLTNDPTGTISKWRGDIRDAVGHLKPARPIAGPVRLELTFGLVRPRSHYLPANRTRPAPVLRSDAPAACVTGPDTDKLERAVLDALTDVIYLDDAQVYEVLGRKVWIEAGGPGLRATAAFMDEVPTIGATSVELRGAFDGAPPVAAGQVALDL